jgi:hypothetical protein
MQCQKQEKQFVGSPVMADLRGIRIKIDRAKKHLADLNAAIRTFQNGWPYTIKIEKDEKTGYETHKFFLLVPIPDEWGAIVGDCVHNLRSALDLLACELIRANGGIPGDYAAFPVGSNFTHFNSSAVRRINGASADAIKLVRRLKPYDGGNDTLWRLHRIDIADKHQLLIPVAAAHKEFGVQYDIQGAGPPDYTPPMWLGPASDRKFPLKNGDELISYKRVVAPGIKDETKFHFTFEIAFGEGQIFDGEPVVARLDQLIRFTERIINLFAKRILKIAWSM